MISLLMITNDPATAKQAVACGVDRIFVDLEKLGKTERQAGRNSWMSHHSLSDITNVRAVLPNHELLVRIDPLNSKSSREINDAISRGADFIMLPMFRSVDEVLRVRDFIDGRVGFIPLVETAAAMALSEEIVSMDGVTEMFAGLNDLHLDKGQNFMFEPVVDGTIERFSEICRSQKLPFGFGGIAGMHEGDIPGKLVLSEHVRMGSSRVILSRTFRREKDGSDWSHFQEEIRKLRSEELRLESEAIHDLDKNKEQITTLVRKIVAKIKAEQSR